MGYIILFFLEWNTARENQGATSGSFAKTAFDFYNYVGLSNLQHTNAWAQPN